MVVPFQVHGGHIVRRELQDAGRSGHLLGTYAFLRAEKKASAAGLRTNLVFLADHSHGLGRVAERPQSAEGQEGHGSDAQDEEN